jgi:hypothetical protein
MLKILCCTLPIHPSNFGQTKKLGSCSNTIQANLMFGGLEAFGGIIFYTGTQNGSKLEIWPLGILIDAFELKLRPF